MAAAAVAMGFSRRREEEAQPGGAMFQMQLISILMGKKRISLITL